MRKGIEGGFFGAYESFTLSAVALTGNPPEAQRAFFPILAIFKADLEAPLDQCGSQIV